MAITAEQVKVGPGDRRLLSRTPKLSAVPHDEYVYLTEKRKPWKKIGTLQKTEDGYVAHMLFQPPGSHSKLTSVPWLVKIAAGDADRDALIAIMREARNQLPDSHTPVKPSKWRKKIGDIHTASSYILKDGQLQEVANLSGAMRDDTLVDHPTDRVVTRVIDGGERTDVQQAVEVLKAEMMDIAATQHRIVMSERKPVKGERPIIGASETIGELRVSQHQWVSTDGRRKKDMMAGTLKAYALNSDNVLSPLPDASGFAMIPMDPRGQDHSWKARAQSAWNKLSQNIMDFGFYPHDELGRPSQEIVDIGSIIQAGAIDQGARDNQEDSLGINGKMRLSDIGGIRGLAESLVGIGYGSAQTVEGQVREINNLKEEFADLVEQGKIHGVGVVADGMGGSPGGEFASALAVYVFQRELVNELKAASEESNIESIARKAAEKANQAVFAYKLPLQEGETQQSNPATGFAAYVIDSDNKAIFLKAGDCRIYWQRGEGIRRVLADQSYVDNLVMITEPVTDKRGTHTPIRPSETFTHAERNLITSAFGLASYSGEGLLVDRGELAEGDRVYVTTDGAYSGFNPDTKEQPWLKDAFEAGDMEMQIRLGEGMSRKEAIDCAFGVMFRDILLRGCPGNLQHLVRKLVNSYTRGNPSDNAAAIVAVLPSRSRNTVALAA